MLIAHFWMKIPKNEEETKLVESYRFLDIEKKDDPQIKEMVEDWCSDFPQWYNKSAYIKFGYDIISKEEINDDIRKMIADEIIRTEQGLKILSQHLADLKEY